MKNTLQIEVHGFPSGKPIPRRYTGDGDDVSPRIVWRGVPESAKELVLIVEDPDAPRSTPFIHWAAFHIPPADGDLPEAIPAAETIETPAHFDQGRNDFGSFGYGGPAPPKGHGAHHYHFRLFALDSHVSLPPGAGAHDLRRAIEGHILDQADYIGTYAR